MKAPRWLGGKRARYEEPVVKRSHSPLAPTVQKKKVSKTAKAVKGNNNGVRELVVGNYRGKTKRFFGRKQTRFITNDGTIVYSTTQEVRDAGLIKRDEDMIKGDDEPCDDREPEKEKSEEELTGMAAIIAAVGKEIRSFTSGEDEERDEISVIETPEDGERVPGSLPQVRQGSSNSTGLSVGLGMSVWNAVKVGNEDAVSEALAHDGTLIKKTRHGHTLLYHANRNGHAQLVRFLLKRGATDPDGRAYRAALNEKCQKVMMSYGQGKSKRGKKAKKKESKGDKTADKSANKKSGKKTDKRINKARRHQATAEDVVEGAAIPKAAADVYTRTQTWKIDDQKARADLDTDKRLDLESLQGKVKEASDEEGYNIMHSTSTALGTMFRQMMGRPDAAEDSTDDVKNENGAEKAEGDEKGEGDEKTKELTQEKASDKVTTERGRSSSKTEHRERGRSESLRRRVKKLVTSAKTKAIGEEKGKRDEAPGYSAGKDDSKHSASDTAVLPASALIGGALTGAAISKPSETGYISNRSLSSGGEPGADFLSTTFSGETIKTTKTNMTNKTNMTAKSNFTTKTQEAKKKLQTMFRRSSNDSPPTEIGGRPIETIETTKNTISSNARAIAPVQDGSNPSVSPLYSTLPPRPDSSFLVDTSKCMRPSKFKSKRVQKVLTKPEILRNTESAGPKVNARTGSGAALVVAAAMQDIKHVKSGETNCTSLTGNDSRAASPIWTPRAVVLSSDPQRSVSFDGENSEAIEALRIKSEETAEPISKAPREKEKFFRRPSLSLRRSKSESKVQKEERNRKKQQTKIAKAKQEKKTTFKIVGVATAGAAIAATTVGAAAGANSGMEKIEPRSETQGAFPSIAAIEGEARGREVALAEETKRNRLGSAIPDPRYLAAAERKRTKVGDPDKFWDDNSLGTNSESSTSQSYSDDEDSSSLGSDSTEREKERVLAMHQQLSMENDGSVRILNINNVSTTYDEDYSDTSSSSDRLFFVDDDESAAMGEVPLESMSMPEVPPGSFQELEQECCYVCGCWEPREVTEVVIEEEKDFFVGNCVGLE